MERRSTDNGRVEADAANLFPFQSEGKGRLWGYMNGQGKVIIMPQWQSKQVISSIYAPSTRENWTD
jgi:hypothetical protein